MYWQADATGGLSGGAYTLTLTADGAAGVTNLNTLRIIKRPSSGGDWVLDGTAGTNSGTVNVPVIVRAGMSGFSQFTYGSDNTNTLPVTWLSFTGQTNGREVILRWAATNEYNNNYYTVEHSADGRYFEAIGVLPGMSTTAPSSSYSFIHKNVAAGTHYYRLKQSDADESYTYSKIINCFINNEPVITCYPNPASGTITIQGDNSFTFMLFDSNGHYLGRLFAGMNNIHYLPPGIYFIKFEKSILRFEKQ
jgi:hypothetical protein